MPGRQQHIIMLDAGDLEPTRGLVMPAVSEHASDTGNRFRFRLSRVFVQRVSKNPNGHWMAMKASSALWLQPAPCGGLVLQRRVRLLTGLDVSAISARGAACCTS